LNRWYRIKNEPKKPFDFAQDKGVTILGIFIALWISLSRHNANIAQQQIAAAESSRDPNHPVEVYFGDSQYQSLQKMAESLGVIIYPEDQVKTLPPPEMGLGSQINIARATPVKVYDAKKLITYHTWSSTISDLLKEKSIELLGQDSSTPTISTPISYNMTVTITRVAEVEVKETETISYKTVKKNDSTLEKGKTRTDQKGINGEKVVTYKVKRIDGVEVSRDVIDTQITKQSQDEILIVGTKVVVYGSGTATWYARNATMVAASNTIPKGTMVHVVATSSGKSVNVLIDDTGIQGSAIIDLSDDAFAALAPLGAGVISVRVEKYYP